MWPVVPKAAPNEPGPTSSHWRPTKKVEVSGRGNYGLKPDEIKVKDAIGDIFLNSDDTIKKYNLVIETHKEAGYK